MPRSIILFITLITVPLALMLTEMFMKTFKHTPSADSTNTVFKSSKKGVINTICRYFRHENGSVERSSTREPSSTKFFWLKLDILTKSPVNNFSFVRDHSQAIFCFQNLDKKDFDGIRTLLATKFLRLKLCKMHIL